MQICYNGVDITPSVQVESLMCLDDWGATPDSIDPMAADGGQWSRWKPQKGDTLEIRDKGWQSGPQAIDAISQRAGKIRLQALSLPKGGRTPHSQAWENLSLFAVGGELAARYGLSLEVYGSAPACPRIDQAGEGDFAFLSRFARREGFALKILSGRLVLYDWRQRMQSAPALALSPGNLLGDPAFDDRSDGLYGGCTLRWGEISATAQLDAAADQLAVTDVPVSDYAQALRYAGNLLDYSRRGAYTGRMEVPLSLGAAAGNMAALSGFGLADGLWFVDRAVHDFVRQSTMFWIVKAGGALG